MKIWTNKAGIVCYTYDNGDWRCYQWGGISGGWWTPIPLDPGRAVVGELHASLRARSGDKVTSHNDVLEWSPRLERFQTLPQNSSWGPPYQSQVRQVLYALSPLAVQLAIRWGVEPHEVDVAAYERGRAGLRAALRSLVPARVPAKD